MGFRISGGGKVSYRSGSFSYSNRGGVRVRLGGGLSVGKSGIRYSVRSGPFHFSTGRTGTRFSIGGSAGPLYVGMNKSGGYFGVSAASGHPITAATSLAGQRGAMAAGMVVPADQLHRDLRALVEANVGVAPVAAPLMPPLGRGMRLAIAWVVATLAALLALGCFNIAIGTADLLEAHEARVGYAVTGSGLVVTAIFALVLGYRPR